VGTVGLESGDVVLFIVPHPRHVMVDREKVLAVLRRRFPGAPDAQTAAAANAIVGLDDEWREVECTDLPELLERLRSGHEFRLIERLPAVK
jgi:hypothetical protein